MLQRGDSGAECDGGGDSAANGHLRVGTLVRGTFWIRLPWTLLLLIISWCGFAWGIAIDKGHPDVGAMLGVGLVGCLGSSPVLCH